MNTAAGRLVGLMHADPATNELLNGDDMMSSNLSLRIRYKSKPPSEEYIPVSTILKELR